MSRLWLVGLVVAAACGSGDSKLRVTGLDPEQGDADGGQYVKIYGNGFTCNGNCVRNAKVYFGSRKAQVIRFASDSELVVEAPGGRQDEKVDVQIYFEPGGMLKIDKAFTFKAKAAPALDQPAPPKK